MTALSVNLNKVALLRNRRASGHPSVIQAAIIALQSGADGITVHPRQDQRHITDEDVALLSEVVRRSKGAIEYNVEGYPSEKFIQLVEAIRPHQVTLVPDSTSQLTSDHGWPMPGSINFLAPIVARLKKMGSRVSLFADPKPCQVPSFAETGAERIELYTGPYAAAFGSDQENAALKKCRETVAEARRVGLGVNAGHDLNLDNLSKFLGISGVLEVSIGHHLICDAMTMGLAAAVRAYKTCVSST